MFDIEEELKKVPTVPGVYMHKDGIGRVIYVGKAVNLRNRLRQYFRRSSQTDPKLRAMIRNVAEFEYITCATETEALILECNLIKKYEPHYNILLKDDKTYPYIEVTLGEEYPRIIRTRRRGRYGSRYFGPYSDSGAVKKIIEMIGEIYPVKQCRQLTFPKNARPCLSYFIERCEGMCVNDVDREKYMEMIREITDILSGNDAALTAKLRKKMQEASDDMRYEEAAKYRDNIEALARLSQTQRASMVAESDMDVLIPIDTGRATTVARYQVRDGKLIGRETFSMSSGEASVSGSAPFGEADSPSEPPASAAPAGTRPEEALRAFIEQFYTTALALPKEIILPRNIEDKEILEEVLNVQNRSNGEAGSDTFHKTRITVPERGRKRAVLRLAEDDAIELSKSIDEKAARERERRDELRRKLSAVVERAAAAGGAIARTIPEGDEREYRLEIYDVSNLNGIDTVGAMVVYEGKEAQRKDYRKFRIKTAVSGDDYGAHREMIYRRLKRAKQGDRGFEKYPDLIVIDGGLGHVRAVKTVTDAMNVPIPVIGLAKDDAHRTRAVVFSDGSEIELHGDRLLFSYFGTMQEEVHRFAITFQRNVRGKKMTASGLENIPGIGATRRKALMERFRSIDGVRKATYEELLDVPGMNSKAAESVIGYFAKEK